MKIPRFLRALGACLVAMAVPGEYPEACEPEQMDNQPKPEKEPDMPVRTRINPELIKPWPEVNPREDYNVVDMTLLFDSIEQAGLMEPLKVNIRTEQVGDEAPMTTYQLIDGMGRLDAICALDLAEVDVEIYDNLSIERALDIVSSACLRRPFNVIEQCRHIARLDHAGRSLAYIARTMGLSESTVAKRLAIDGLCDEVKALMIRDYNALPIHQAMLLVGLDLVYQIELAEEIAPETGRVMTEAEARDRVKQYTATPTPLIDEPATNETTPPQEGSGQTGGDDSTHSTPDLDPSDAGSKPITPPKPGSAKDPNLTGLRRELPAVMRVTGVFDISKAGVKIKDAHITCEAGVVEFSWDLEAMVLDLDADGIKSFQEFVAIEAEAMKDSKSPCQ